MKHSHWLWWGLAVLWSLLLLQAIFPPDSDADRSWVVGGILWIAVLTVLIGLGYRSWKRSRRE